MSDAEIVERVAGFLTDAARQKWSEIHNGESYPADSLSEDLLRQQHQIAQAMAHALLPLIKAVQEAVIDIHEGAEWERNMGWIKGGDRTDAVANNLDAALRGILGDDDE